MDAYNLELSRRQELEMAITNGLAEGIEKGRAEGEAKGERKKQLGIAANMKNYGMPTDQISLMTGLPSEEVEAL